jgi:hypothetical protein
MGSDFVIIIGPRLLSIPWASIHNIIKSDPVYAQKIKLSLSYS